MSLLHCITLISSLSQRQGLLVLSLYSSVIILHKSGSFFDMDLDTVGQARALWENTEEPINSIRKLINEEKITVVSEHMWGKVWGGEELESSKERLKQEVSKHSYNVSQEISCLLKNFNNTL